MRSVTGIGDVTLSIYIDIPFIKSSERPEWNFTETGPKPKYGFFTEPEPKLNTETIL